MRKILIPAVGAALICAVMFFQARTVEPVLCDAPVVRLSEIVGYASEAVEASEAELNILPDDTEFEKRLYQDADGNWFLVSVVVSGRSRESIHRPEMCLPSHGVMMASPRTVRVAGVDWHFISLTSRDAPPMGFAYTFFNQDGFMTDSHFLRIFRDVWDRSMRGRIDRWVMVTVSSSHFDEKRLSGFLERLRGVVVR